MCASYFPTVYVMVESKCIITPKSPSSLTAEGGRLANNTKDVEIECSCINNRGAVLRNVVWLSPAKHQVELKSNANHGAPYSHLTKNNMVAVLIVPNFSDAYNGTYTCTTENNGTNRNVTATVALICKHSDIYIYHT